LDLPDKCVITAVLRRGQLTVPHGDLRFEAGDEMLAVVGHDALRQLRELFGSQG
jgi:Trk K+ transport system NAD-binding subunit